MERKIDPRDKDEVSKVFGMLCEFFEMNQISKRHGMNAMWNFFVYMYKQDLKMDYEAFKKVMLENIVESRKMWEE